MLFRKLVFNLSFCQSQKFEIIFFERKQIFRLTILRFQEADALVNTRTLNVHMIT